jgi:hypothetical protein
VTGIFAARARARQGRLARGIGGGHKQGQDPLPSRTIDNPEMGLETLAGRGFTMITEGDLNEDE